MTLSLLLTPVAAAAQDGWHALQVPGGRATLRALGVDDGRERSAVMIDLIRRLHFSTRTPEQLNAATRNVPTTAADSVTLPQPLSNATWERVVGRSLPPQAMFRSILTDVPARLLFHGLAGVDASTREWFEQHPDLLRSIYRNVQAAKAFAMFAPSIEVVNDRVIVPGGTLGESRWSRAIGTPASDANRFVERVFLDRDGRIAGLYFLAAFVDAPRRRFILHTDDASGDERFVRLVSSFAGCYPKEANDYPFVLRPNDPALLLLAAQLAPDGRLAGPRSSSFWDSVFDRWDLTPNLAMRRLGSGVKQIDAAAIVERLCSAPTRERAAVFATLLTGQRAFSAIPAQKANDAVVALRVRRLFPALFLAMERAGVRSAETFAAIGKHAAQLDRLNDVSTQSVLQQFQGALALILRAAASGTLAESEWSRLLRELSEVPIADGRYNGRMALWLRQSLLPAVGFKTGANAEQTVAAALAGPPVAPPTRIRWEGLDYVVDYSRSTRDRLLTVRAKQGGDTIDGAIEKARVAKSASEVQVADAVLGQVLASWAYAPHVGGADSGALVGGDSSSRHDLGLREVNRTRFEQRWSLAVAPGDRGMIAGSYLGLEASLATWSLRRLSADTIPPQPTVSDNDRMSLFAMVSLADPVRTTNADMRRISDAIRNGRRQVADSGRDVARLQTLARAAQLSPWKRAALPWMAAAEPDRIDEQFSLSALATLGGVSAAQIPAWGTSSIPMACLCVTAPVEGVPELIAGRPVDGIVGARSNDLPLRAAELLTELQMPAQLMPAVLAYAMRDYIDRLAPMHPADVDAFARAAPLLTRTMVEDYLGAIAAVGPLRPAQ